MGTVLFLAAGRTSVSAGPQDQEKAKGGATVEERLDRIERLLQALIDQGKAESRISASSPRVVPQGRLFRRPDSIPKRELRSTRSLPEAAAPEAAADRDLDGLTDGEEATLGTDPANPDTDGDALLDGWEVMGVNGIDLPGKGASPLHKDIFVEMVYMERASASNGLAPSDSVLRAIVAAFAASPVTNPDGATGVNIHLERGNLVNYVDDINPYDVVVPQIKAANFDPAKGPVYHYMIWANAYNGGTSSGVSLGIPHSDFIVTLGRWNNGAGGNDQQKIGTFIHELGHNLGRRHGGSDDVNYKPCHLSVMNYFFQTSGVFHNGTRLFTYQSFPLPGLNEADLIEADGLSGSSALAGYHTEYFAPGGAVLEVPADGPIDWNNNGIIDSAPVAVDLNNDTQLEFLQATPDEWSILIFNGGSIGSLATLQGAQESATLRSRRLPFVELDEETEQRIRQFREQADRVRARPKAAAPKADANRRGPLEELNAEDQRRLDEARIRGRAEQKRPN
jgi:hypothetical protein